MQSLYLQQKNLRKYKGPRSTSRVEKKTVGGAKKEQKHQGGGREFKKSHRGRENLQRIEIC